MAINISKLKRFKFDLDGTPLSQFLRKCEFTPVEQSRENDPAREAFVDAHLAARLVAREGARQQVEWDLGV